MSCDEIDNIVIYDCVVAKFCPQKEDPNQVQMTARVNLIKYPGKITTRTAYLNKSKVLWNSVLTTKYSKFMGLDIENIYLRIPMDRYEYMKISLSLFYSTPLTSRSSNKN